MIQINGLNKSLYGGGHRVDILNEIDLTIPSGQFVAITGASGSGKTTLLSLIAGLDEPTEGSIVIDKQDITKLNEDELAELRVQRFGFIFQNFNLIPTLTALENVTLSAELNGANGAHKKSVKLLSLVGLTNRKHHYPVQLSGGEQQRLCLARAFVNEPEIVLADEPTGNLDTKTGLVIIDLLKKLNSEQGITIITATHDTKMLDVSDRIFHMADGKIDRTETRDEIDLQVGKLDGEEVG